MVIQRPSHNPDDGHSLRKWREAITSGLSALTDSLTNYATINQVQKNSFIYCGTAGTSTAYTASIIPTPTTYSSGLALLAQFNVTSGVAPTINVSGLGATSLLQAPATPVATGYFLANQFYLLVHDGSLGFYVVGY